MGRVTQGQLPLGDIPVPLEGPTKCKGVPQIKKRNFLFFNASLAKRKLKPCVSLFAGVHTHVNVSSEGEGQRTSSL